MINQSVVDVSGSALTVSFAVTLDISTELSAWSADLYCKLVYTKVFMWSLFLVSTYNLVVINIDRYLEVVHPLWHRAHTSKSRVLMAIVLVWIWGMMYNTLYLIPTTKVTQGQCMVISA